MWRYRQTSPLPAFRQCFFTTQSGNSCKFELHKAPTICIIQICESRRRENGRKKERTSTSSQNQAYQMHKWKSLWWKNYEFTDISKEFIRLASAVSLGSPVSNNNRLWMRRISILNSIIYTNFSLCELPQAISSLCWVNKTVKCSLIKKVILLNSREGKSDNSELESLIKIFLCCDPSEQQISASKGIFCRERKTSREIAERKFTTENASSNKNKHERNFIQFNLYCFLSFS